MSIGAIIPSVDALLESYGLSYLVTIINILIAFLLARLGIFVVIRILQSTLNHKAKSASPERLKQLQTGASILGGLSKYVFYFFAIAITLGELGLASSMNSLLAAAGIGGLALGIGAQSLISDVVTGLFILFEDQIRVGETVQVGDITGMVESITLRTTTIKGPRGEINIVPNSQIKQVTNFSRSDYLAFADMNILFETDVDRALALMMQEAEKYAAELGEDVVVNGPTSIGIVTMTGDFITLRVGLTVKPMQHWGVQRELVRRFKVRFAKEGIELPYSRVRVLDNG